MRLRTVRPAPMRRRKETATCATMRALRSLPRTKPSVDWLPPSFNVVMRFSRRATAGAGPVRTLTKNATAIVKRRKETSMWTSRARGEKKAERAANKSEERGFGEKLAKEADAVGGHGRAHAEFTFAGDHAGEIEIG